MTDEAKKSSGPAETPRISLPSGLRARILSDAAKTPAPAKGGDGVRLLVLLAAGALWIAFRVIVEGRRADWSALPASATWLPLVDAIGTAVLVSALALSRGRAMVGPSARILWAAALAPILISVTVILLSVRSDATEAAAFAVFGGRYWAAIAQCDQESMTIGVPCDPPPRRGAAPADRRLAGARRCGRGDRCRVVVSRRVLHQACPMASDAGHVLLGHAAPTLPLAAVGALTAWMLDRKRLRRL